ncbi:hypothetical protein HAX54_004101, partial [Datura stramonium]|nr:hypothetical protein [Datura stramonium]
HKRIEFFIAQESPAGSLAKVVEPHGLTWFGLQKEDKYAPLVDAKDRLACEFPTIREKGHFFWETNEVKMQ